MLTEEVRYRLESVRITQVPSAAQNLLPWSSIVSQRFYSIRLRKVKCDIYFQLDVVFIRWTHFRYITLSTLLHDPECLCSWVLSGDMSPAPLDRLVRPSTSNVGCRVESKSVPV